MNFATEQERITHIHNMLAARSVRKLEQVRANGTPAQKERYGRRIIGTGQMGFVYRGNQMRRRNLIRNPVVDGGTQVVGNCMIPWMRTERPDGKRDKYFNVSGFMGDMYWFMEVYAAYLSPAMPALGVPSQALMRMHFRAFWSAFLIYLGVSEPRLPHRGFVAPRPGDRLLRIVVPGPPMVVLTMVFAVNRCLRCTICSIDVVGQNLII